MESKLLLLALLISFSLHNQKITTYFVLWSVHTFEFIFLRGTFHRKGVHLHLPRPHLHHSPHSSAKCFLREGARIHAPTVLLPLSQQVPALSLHNAHYQWEKCWNYQVQTFDKGIMISFQYSPLYRDTVFSSFNYNIYQLLIRLTDAFHGMLWTAFFPAPGLHSKLLNCNQLQKLPVHYHCSETLQAWCKIYYL